MAACLVVVFQPSQGVAGGFSTTSDGFWLDNVSR